MVFEGNITVDIAAHMGDGSVAKVGGINTLRKQGKGAEKILVLSVVVEAECGFHFAAANAEPSFEAVICDRPIQRRMVLPQLSEIAVIDLRARSAVYR